MSTLEKFGILVILILVVIIGVVAVWGVGGEKDNPFAQDPAGDGVALVDPAAPPAVEPGKEVPGWTNGVPPVAGPGTGTDPVAPPALGVTPNVPGPGTNVAVLPPAGATTYKVQKGDTGASIAKKTLGDPNKWKLIAAANGNKDARRLKVDEILNIPAVGGTSVADTGMKPAGIPGNSLVPPVNPADGPTETIRAVPAPAPAPEAAAREVEVRSGDTLYEIARRELGDPNLYYKILKVNPGLDPKKIRPGMKVKLPVL